MVLLNGPVKNALFCLMGRYRNVCVWFMARNCRFPRLELTVANVGTTGYPKVGSRLPLQATEVGTHASQPGNHRLPSELPFLKVGHCKELPVPNRGNQRLPWQGTAGSQTLKLTVPNLGTRGYYCKELPVPKVRIYVFEAKQLSL